MSDHADRFRFDPRTRMIGLRLGKVELGQHVHEACEVMAAEALGVAARCMRVLPVTTDDSPDDGLTVGSLSIQVTGRALAEAAGALALALRTRAGQRLNVAAEAVTLDPEALLYRHGEATCDLFDVAAALDATLVGQGPEGPAGAALVADAVTGARRFLPDMTLPGMLHARALRGRSPAEVAQALPEGCRLVQDGGFAAVVADDEASLLALWPKLAVPEASGDGRCDGPVGGWIREARQVTTRQGPDPAPEAEIAVTASRPFLLHGSIAPSCAIAHLAEGRLTVWTHSQGVFPLRDQIARVLGLAPGSVRLVHVPSAGCYGHTGADDAALDAALVAMQIEGRPVRVAWPREDEARHGPVGAPMVAEARVTLDAERRIRAWHQEIWSAPHGQRPGGGGRVNLLAAEERAPGPESADVADLPEAIGWGAARNAVPLYAIPAVTVSCHIAQDLPVRSSSLRGLGTQVNTIAIEAAMDRLAGVTGESPFAVRARHLEDSRALAVLGRLETLCGEAGGCGGEEATGIALGRYKNKAAYAAVAARVRLEDAPRLVSLHAVVDAGRVVSRDGALNQIEGGMVQAASWTLREGTVLRGGRIEAEGWEDYPVLAWSEMPDLRVDLLEAAADAPPLGVGECMVGPTSAAIVNAIGLILGETLAELPLDRDRLIEVLSR